MRDYWTRSEEYESERGSEENSNPTPTGRSDWGKTIIALPIAAVTLWGIFSLFTFFDNCNRAWIGIPESRLELALAEVDYAFAVGDSRLFEAEDARIVLLSSFAGLQDAIVEYASLENRIVHRIRGDDYGYSKLLADAAEWRLNSAASVLEEPVRQETWIALETLMTEVTWSRESDAVILGEKPTQTLTEVRMKNMPPVEERLYDGVNTGYIAAPR